MQIMNAVRSVSMAAERTALKRVASSTQEAQTQ
jgi:hypothetical protein